MACAPSEDSISLGIRPVWSESSLSAWRKLGSLATHWAHSEDWSDWAEAQAVLSLRWAHMSFCWFCHKAAHLIQKTSRLMSVLSGNETLICRRCKAGRVDWKSSFLFYGCIIWGLAPYTNCWCIPKEAAFLHTRPEFPWTRPGLGNVVLHVGCKTTVVHDVRMTVLTSWRHVDVNFHQTFRRQRPR